MHWQSHWSSRMSGTVSICREWHAGNTTSPSISYFPFTTQDLIIWVIWQQRLVIAKMNSFQCSLYAPGNAYDLSRIVFPNTTFNRIAYEEYSPLFLSWVPSPFFKLQPSWNSSSTTFALSYGLSFASITATVSMGSCLVSPFWSSFLRADRARNPVL